MLTNPKRTSYRRQQCLNPDQGVATIFCCRAPHWCIHLKCVDLSVNTLWILCGYTGLHWGLLWPCEILEHVSLVYQVPLNMDSKLLVGQICEIIVHFMIKAWNLVHGQISNYQNFWGSVPSQKCTLTAAILNFKMAIYFHVMPVTLGIILQ